MRKTCFLAVSGALLAGCATVTHDSSQPVRVQTVSRSGQEIVGASCESATLGPGVVWRSGETVQVPRGFGSVVFTCRAPGVPPATGTLLPMANWGMAGNVVAGGLAGLVTDHVKGNAYNHPEWIRMVFGEDRIFEQRLSLAGTANLGVVRDEWVAETTEQTPSYSDGRQALVLPKQPRVAERVDTGDSVSPADMARLKDLDGLPTPDRATRAAYSAWLTRPVPRAFAFSPKGDWAGAWGSQSQDPGLPADPSERALALCARRAQTACQLYAVNSKVVWKP